MARRDRAVAGEAEGGPSRGIGFFLAAGFLALVIVGAVVTVVGSQGSGANPAPVASSSAPAAAAQPPAAGAGCHPTDTDQSVPTSAPADVTWSLFHVIALPTSPSAGPLIIEGDLARCYAHTPLGALIATEQIGVRSALGPGWRQVTDRQVMPGASRDAWIRLNSASTDNPDQAGIFAQTAGFRYVTYTPQVAVIEHVVRAPDGGLWTYTTTVMWDAGDWKLQIQPDGIPGTPQQEVQSLDGFTAWGGT
jgi:hypothetical protein